MIFFYFNSEHFYQIETPHLSFDDIWFDRLRLHFVTFDRSNLIAIGWFEIIRWNYDGWWAMSFILEFYEYYNWYGTVDGSSFNSPIDIELWNYFQFVGSSKRMKYIRNEISNERMGHEGNIQFYEIVTRCLRSFALPFHIFGRWWCDCVRVCTMYAVRPQKTNKSTIRAERLVRPKGIPI